MKVEMSSEVASLSKNYSAHGSVLDLLTGVCLFKLELQCPKI